jgi:hypothetical protein
MILLTFKTDGGNSSGMRNLFRKVLLLRKFKTLPDSIKVVRQILILFVEVRILVGQPASIKKPL